MSKSAQNIESGLLEFWTECEELTERIWSQLPHLTDSHKLDEAIDSIYRDIHTIKGSAQLFGLKQVSNVAHTIETSLDPVRSKTSPLNAALLQMVHEGIGVIEKMIRAYRDQNVEAQQGLEASIPRWVESSLEIFGGNMPIVKDALELKEVVQSPFRVAPTKEPAQQTSAVAGSVLSERSQNVIKGDLTATSTVSAPVASAGDEHGGADSSSTIRVPVGLLDKLMTSMGEMVLVRNQVLQYASRSDDLGFLNLSQRLDVVTSEIQSEMMKTRMQPMGNILGKFQRLVRDLSKELGKKIELQLSGSETELDKTLLEAVKDPLTHIIRNACDHGIEMPDQRRSAGKSEIGHISVRAFHEGGQVIIEISDDGNGLNPEVLLAKALEKGLITKEKAAAMSEREILNTIFLPGFSTAAKVTNISGRGVGMDVVRSNIDKIGGIVELQSQHGHGTVIRLKIPLTLAIVPAMIVSCEQDRYAIPQVKLLELLRVETNSADNKIEILQGQAVFRLRGNLLPLIYLKEFLGFPTPRGQTCHELPEVVNIVVLKAERQMFGLIVDEIQDTADIVVKPLNRFLKSLNVYSGATVLGDGSVALILDVLGIAQRMLITSDSKLEDAKSDRANQAPYKNVDAQEFLLFKVRAPGKHAIPLDLVHRLEEFKRSDIEMSGGTSVMRYRDSILPIISLNEFLNYKSEVPTPQKDVIPVIVSQRGGRYFGIEVDEILDVLVTESRLDETLSDRAGILGGLISQGEVVVVVDSTQMLEGKAKNMTPAPTRAAVTKTPVAGISVLYAEDNAFFRTRVSTILKNQGIHVETANNGQEAIAVLEKEPDRFSVIISDIEMPRMGGIELAKALRAGERTKNLPLIALTTRFSDSHVKEGLRAGFNIYLEKLNPDELTESVQSFINKKAS